MNTKIELQYFDIKEIRKMTTEELNSYIIALRKKQFQLRMSKASGSLAKTHQIRKVRREIARIKTIKTEKAGHNEQ